MEKRLAKLSDLENLKELYQVVIDHQKYDEYSPDWHMGIYPSDNDFISHIQNNEFYVGLQDGIIVSAGVLTHGDDPIYSKVKWLNPVDSKDVSVIHLFTVSPNYRKKGYSREMFDYLLNSAKENGVKAIHLDVAYGNIPAEKLYTKFGFQHTDTIDVYYEDTGDMKAVIMEKVL